MNIALQRIQEFLENWTKCPKPDATIEELARQNFDSGKFQIAAPLRAALKQVADYLQPIAGDAIFAGKLDALPEALQRRIAEAIVPIDQALRSLLAALPVAPQSGAQPPGIGPPQVNNLTNSVKEKFGDLYALVEPLREIKPIDAERELTGLRQTLGEAQQALAQLKEAEKTGKEAAAYVLTKLNVEELDSAIKHHKWSALAWLVFVILSAVIAFRLAWWLNVPGNCWFHTTFPQPGPSPTYLDFLMNFGRKILLLSAAFTVPLLALRAYYANLHNFIINRQRKISLAAFTQLYALVKDTDPPTKAEVVKQAALTIFAQGSTGFLSKQKATPELLDLMMSLLRAGPR